MGIYFNPDNINFKKDLGLKFYVDKSMIISALNQKIGTSDQFLCVSRPRRFGKSMAMNMMVAYYSKGADSRELFENLKISKDPSFETHLQKYNVIHVDVSGIYNNKPKNYSTVSYITQKVKEELIDAYPEITFDKNETMAGDILKVYLATGQTFIIMLDEYDVLVREQCSRDEFCEYLQFLNGLFKSANLSPAISLAYLTGILPIVRDKIQSKLNNFTEFTMNGAMDLTEFVGFTEKETKDLCLRYNLDFEECQHWYNGYHLNDMDIYNPKSVVCSIQQHAFGNYWTKTGSYEALKNYINLDFKGIKDDVVRMLAGEKIDVDCVTYLNTLTDFKTKDDVFTYLIHLGYLGYDIENKQCYIPNKEIRSEWDSSIKTSDNYSYLMDMISASDNLLDATLDMEESVVAEGLDYAHSTVMSNLTYNKEFCLQSAIVLAYYTARKYYSVVLELPSGRGFADVAFIPYKCDKSAIIVELKNSEKCKTETALDQIKNKRYCQALEHYQGEILLVGVVYNPETKEHTCKIEIATK